VNSASRTRAPALTTALALVSVVVVADARSSGVQSISPPGSSLPDRSSVEAAQREFYNARYESAARMTLETCAAELSALAACELRTAAVLFQIRALLATHSDKDVAWKRCAACPDLLSAFRVALAHGQTAARARLLERPTDDETLFLLGKLDLNYVWLQLGTLGHKTGWDEYWEARRSLDTVLERQPAHVRARVARGWIDYIVATKMPRGTRWLLGGGSRKRGLQAIREAADAEADFFTRTEARFALWDMLVRERDTPGAIATADLLIRDFPDNQELKRFIETHRSSVRRGLNSPGQGPNESPLSLKKNVGLAGQ
jgi:hypothetical protein